MKLPKDMPFVVMDRNLYGTVEQSRLTEDFIEWLVRDCAKEAGRAAFKESPPADEFERGFENGAEYAKCSILARYGLTEGIPTQAVEVKRSFLP